jgi:response regulator RpfG family c-di-GMP phosphodiesterase
VSRSQRGTANTPKAKIVCDVLVREGLLKADQLASVATRLQRRNERVEEALIELGLVSEGDLLRTLAAYYKVNFISTEKLAKVDVNRVLTDTIPQRFAEQVGICPVLFDAKTQALSVVTADPDDLESLREAQLASGAREVKAILTRPAAIRALMAKAYDGAEHAFASLDPSKQMQLQAMLNNYGRGEVAHDLEPTVSVRGDTKPATPERPVPKKDVKDVRARKSVRPAPVSSPAPPRPPPAAAPAVSYLEILHVLVSLLENDRADLRGHSAQVARLARRVAEKMNFDSSATAALVAAAFVHDLGKTGSFHLTTLNCSEYEGHKVAAQKTHGMPGRLLEPARLSADTIQALNHMYERYDGRGFPDAMTGKDIPLGARVLAICDTYADLTSNARNPFRKVLSPRDACGVMSKYKETIFDPNLVDVFRGAVIGEDQSSGSMSNRWRVLVVDVDVEETTILELRMSEQGFLVKTVRGADQALKILAEGETDLVVGEIDLAQGDGLSLLGQARREAWGKELPWVVYTRRKERAVAQKAFELGVLDFVTKPASADLLAAKITAMLDQRTSVRAIQPGLSGSLSQMALPDMIQVLFHGRKSGALKIRASTGSGEIHLNDGNVVDAVWRDLHGEEAFYAMLKLSDGEFGLDPTFRATARVINQSSEALLLEGMRRMDEGL